MGRKHNPKEINLQLDSVVPVANERGTGIVIYWNSDIGFGQYTLYHEKGQGWRADAECMDKGEDKAFLEELMRLFISQVTIE